MKIKYSILILAVAIMTSCEKFLERPPLTSEDDLTAWKSEENIRMYANKFYTDFFIGYGLLFNDQGGAAYLSYNTSDDVLSLGNQANLTRAVPNSSIWSYSSLRSVNIMIERVTALGNNVLDGDAKAHWLGVGRFFRAMRYAQLVTSYGDVPFYNAEVFADDIDAIYKPRDPRDMVMDSVYNDLEYAFENVRVSDGPRTVNRDVVAAYITRIALHEATWQKYYYNNNERAEKFLSLAIEAGDYVMNTGRYDIVMDYKSLFTSKDLAGSRDAILYRAYDAALQVTHSVASYSNLVESRGVGPTADLIKSYICVDGRPYQASTVADADKFDLTTMIRTRDPRFEATFYSEPEPLNRASFWYVTKFLPREAEKRVKVDGLAPAPEFTSSNNDTDYPVMRYAEVLLNWIEAKAELATLGGAAVVQTDIDVSINRIRNRPVAADARDRGVVNTAPMTLGALVSDPSRDPLVSDLIWEIRRERRMEFTFEYNRLADLRRWSKIEYLDTDSNEDLMSGGWVDFPTELPEELKPANVGALAVVKEDGTETVYNGSNASQMMGFYKNLNNGGRLPFLNLVNVNPYLQPVGLVQIDDYATKGYELKQTEGWGN